MVIASMNHTTAKLRQEERDSFYNVRSYHDSSVRYIIAGMYGDAIQSITNGLLGLGVAFPNQSDEDLSSFHSFIDEEDLKKKQLDQYVIDANPAGQYYSQSLTGPDLTTAMIYNLALSFHLYSTTNSKKEDDTYNAMLNQTFTLYKEAERRLEESEKFSSLLLSVQNNICHLIHQALLRRTNQTNINNSKEHPKDLSK